MRHYMKLHSNPFEMILAGKKSFEIRLNDEKRQSLKQGDEILFQNSSDDCQIIITKIINLYKFSSFEKLYEKLPLEKCGYLDSELSTAKASDMYFYYKLEDEIKYGVLGIEIKIIE